MERWRGEGKKVNSYPYLFRQSFARAIVVFHPFHRDYIRGIGCMFILRMAERERKRERRRRPRFFAADKVKERARENNYFLLRASSLFCLGHQREFSVYSRWRKSHMHDGYTRTSKNLLTERFQRAFSFSTSIRSVETRTFHCCKRSAHARNRISNLTVCGRRVFSVGPSSDSRDNFRAYATSVFTNNVEIIRSSHIPNLANRFSISYTWYRAAVFHFLRHSIHERSRRSSTIQNRFYPRSSYFIKNFNSQEFWCMVIVTIISYKVTFLRFWLFERTTVRRVSSAFSPIDSTWS